jgi:hypothetical protein
MQAREYFFVTEMLKVSKLSFFVLRLSTSEFIKS